MQHEESEVEIIDCYIKLDAVDLTMKLIWVTIKQDDNFVINPTITTEKKLMIRTLNNAV
jgi:hypothetical protein